MEDDWSLAIVQKRKRSIFRLIFFFRATPKVGWVGEKGNIFKARELIPATSFQSQLSAWPSTIVPSGQTNKKCRLFLLHPTPLNSPLRLQSSHPSFSPPLLQPVPDQSIWGCLFIKNPIPRSPQSRGGGTCDCLISSLAAHPLYITSHKGRHIFSSFTSYQPAITHHPSLIIHHPSLINHQPSTIIHHPSSIINNPPSTINHSSSIIHHPSSVVNHRFV